MACNLCPDVSIPPALAKRMLGHTFGFAPGGYRSSRHPDCKITAFRIIEDRESEFELKIFSMHPGYQSHWRCIRGLILSGLLELHAAACSTLPLLQEGTALRAGELELTITTHHELLKINMRNKTTGCTDVYSNFKSRSRLKSRVRQLPYGCGVARTAFKDILTEELELQRLHRKPFKTLPQSVQVNGLAAASTGVSCDVCFHILGADWGIPDTEFALKSIKWSYDDEHLMTICDLCKEFEREVLKKIGIKVDHRQMRVLLSTGAGLQERPLRFSATLAECEMRGACKVKVCRKRRGKAPGRGWLKHFQRCSHINLNCDPDRYRGRPRVSHRFELAHVLAHLHSDRGLVLCSSSESAEAVAEFLPKPVVAKLTIGVAQESQHTKENAVPRWERPPQRCPYGCDLVLRHTMFLDDGQAKVCDHQDRCNRMQKNTVARLAHNGCMVWPDSMKDFAASAKYVIILDEISVLGLLSHAVRFISEPSVPIFYLKPPRLLLHNLRLRGFQVAALPSYGVLEFQWVEQEMAVVAAMQSRNALAEAREEVKNDEDVFLAAVQVHWGAFQWANNVMRCNRRLALTAIAKNDHAMHYASSELREELEEELQQWNKSAGSGLSLSRSSYAAAQLMPRMLVQLTAKTLESGALDFLCHNLAGDQIAHMLVERNEESLTTRALQCKIAAALGMRETDFSVILPSGDRMQVNGRLLQDCLL